MNYMIREMILYLIVAALIGFWTGWSIKSILAHRRLQHLQRTWKINIASQEHELKKLKKK